PAGQGYVQDGRSSEHCFAIAPLISEDVAIGILRAAAVELDRRTAFNCLIVAGICLWSVVGVVIARGQDVPGELTVVSSIAGDLSSIIQVEGRVELPARI